MKCNILQMKKSKQISVTYAATQQLLCCFCTADQTMISSKVYLVLNNVILLKSSELKNRKRWLRKKGSQC